MKNAHAILIYLVTPLFFYPVYFFVTNIIDSAFGSQQLIEWLYFNFHSLLVKIFLQDWMDSIWAMYGILLFILFPLRLALSTFGKYSLIPFILSSTLIVFSISLVLGFREIGLLSNTVYMFILSALLFWFTKLLKIDK